MKKTARKCVICGEVGTEKWTLSQGPTITVADLCLGHSQPMHDAVQAVKDAQAATGSNPTVLAVDTRTVQPGKAPRTPSFAPLTDWTPPADSTPTGKAARSQSFAPLKWTPPDE